MTMFCLSAMPAALTDLKCCLCEKILSVPPILHNGTETICGRCAFINPETRPERENNDWFRQHTYELLAKHLSFPCCNTPYGCKENMKWGDVEEHENRCVFKKLFCPFNNKELGEASEPCLWTGSAPMLNEHIENTHVNVNNQKIPEIDFLSLKSTVFYITRVTRKMMVAVIKYSESENKYYCFLMSNGLSTDCSAYRYQIELSDESRTNMIVLRRDCIEDLICMEYNLSNIRQCISIDLTVIPGMLQNPDKMLGRIAIIKKSTKELAYLTPQSSTTVNNTLLDENFLRELECPVCKSYLSTPIYICTTGHSYCSDCKKQMRECPSCKKRFSEGRNFTLEKLSSYFTYPCINKESGCTAMSSLSDLKSHEKDCAFSGYKCFLGCLQFLNANNALSHITNTHKNALVCVGEMNIFDCTDKARTSNHAICFGNDLFHFVIIQKLNLEVYSDSSDDAQPYHTGSLTFKMEEFGVESSEYQFEIEFVVPDEGRGSLSFMANCGGKNNQKRSGCITVPHESIMKFMKFGTLLFYKVHLRFARNE